MEEKKSYYKLIEHYLIIIIFFFIILFIANLGDLGQFIAFMLMIIYLAAKTIPVAEQIRKEGSYFETFTSPEVKKKRVNYYIANKFSLFIDYLLFIICIYIFLSF